MRYPSHEVRKIVKASASYYDRIRIFREWDKSATQPGWKGPKDEPFWFEEWEKAAAWRLTCRHVHEWVMSLVLKDPAPPDSVVFEGLMTIKEVSDQWKAQGTYPADDDDDTPEFTTNMTPAELKAEFGLVDVPLTIQEVPPEFFPPKCDQYGNVKHYHSLTYQCPKCSIQTVVRTRLLIPHPSCHFPPKPVLRMDPYHLECGHGDIPLSLIHPWFTQILQSFNFQAGYTFINNFGQTLQFDDLTKNT